MNNYFKPSIDYWKLLFGLSIIQLLTFLSFRVIFFILNTFRLTEEFFNHQSDIYFLSFRYDLMITCYLLIPVWLLLTIRLFALGIASKLLMWCLVFYFIMVDFFTLLMTCTDLPFYTFFNERINPSVILWVNNPDMMFNFVKDSVQYIPFFILYIVAFAIVIYFQIKLIKKYFHKEVPQGKAPWMMNIAVMALVFIGMRGGTQLRPLEVQDAFITINNYVNQFSLNPVLTYVNSYVNQNTSYLSEDDFNRFMLEQKIDIQQKFPLSKQIIETDSAHQWNVVLVLMESMTGNVMQQFGCKENLTPFLDSLAQVSVNVTRHYSTGTHTCNGIYSTLFGYPSFMGVHPMSNPNSVNQSFYGMPSVLKEKGYQNIFFTSHDCYWDNMQGFLPKNGMDTIYDFRSHRQGTQVNALGVPDEIVFETALKKIDEHSLNGPVFATVLTVSTHTPYTIPEWSTFKKLPQHSDAMKNSYKYADWSLKNFFTQAEKKPWFKNTIFVFVADHGINLEPESDMPLSFHRTPLLFYQKDMLPQQLNVLASQTDIFPTLMGLLNQSYTNNTMGIDLLKEKRSYVYFVGTNTIGCVDSSYFYIYRKFGSSSLTRMNEKVQEDLSDKMQDKKAEMEHYALGSLQLCAHILEQRKVGKRKD
jgi:phosphoglycerol transferase MdoB-like AlkP superfamily enzyme